MLGKKSIEKQKAKINRNMKGKKSPTLLTLKNCLWKFSTLNQRGIYRQFLGSFRCLIKRKS